MQNIVILMILLSGFLAPAPVFSQYTKLVKGQPVPYDTAVAIQINTYRAESKKFEQADNVISDLNLRVAAYEADAAISRLNEKATSDIIAILAKQTEADAETKDKLYRDLARLNKRGDKGPGFFSDPRLWGALGLLSGFLIFK